MFVLYILISALIHTKKIYINSGANQKIVLINKNANLKRSPKKCPPKATTSRAVLSKKLQTTTTGVIAEPVEVPLQQLTTAKIEPLDKKEVEKALNSPKCTLKQASNGHCLNVVNRKRSFGLCVYCLKNPAVDKKKLSKVNTFCTACPGSCWMCELCFDEMHIA